MSTTRTAISEQPPRVAPSSCATSPWRKVAQAMLVWAVLGASAAVGCGGSQQQDPLAEGPLVDARGPGFDPIGELQPGEDRGTLERAEVDRVLLEGPQSFISGITVSPAELAGKFIGFRIERLFPGDERFSRVDLHPGDIVTRVNGLPIERPDQFMKVWEQLRVADELRIEYVRGGAVRVLRWQIVDSRTVQPELVQ